jgi:hypothetical protein
MLFLYPNPTYIPRPMKQSTHHFNYCVTQDKPRYIQLHKHMASDESNQQVRVVRSQSIGKPGWGECS